MITHNRSSSPHLYYIILYTYQKEPKVIFKCLIILFEKTIELEQNILQSDINRPLRCEKPEEIKPTTLTKM